MVGAVGPYWRKGTGRGLPLEGTHDRFIEPAKDLKERHHPGVMGHRGATCEHRTNAARARLDDPTMGVVVPFNIDGP
jgi:hypothetical protein